MNGIEIKASKKNLAPAIKTYFNVAKTRILEAKSENTWKAYMTGWKDFSAWCAHYGAKSLPADPEMVAAYIAYLEEKGRKASTIKLRLVAISQIHQYAGLTSPTKDFFVREALKGTFRRIGLKQEGKQPVWLEDLRNMVRQLPKTKKGLRDRALLVIGFAGAFRRSELVALDVEDVAVTRDGLVITIRQSKTDPYGLGEKVALPFGSNPLTCPVRSLQGWLSAGAITTGAIFRQVNRHDQVLDRLTGHGAGYIIKQSCESVGLDSKNYGGHSLRAGFVTEAANHQKSEHAIMKQTRHKSTETLRRYIRDGNLFNDNPASGIGL